MDAKIHLVKSQFFEKEKPLLEFGGLSASTFLFDSGVHAVRLKGKRTELILLPFQGQQIWQAVVDGHDLTMKSMFTQPYPTNEYLKTYGGFLIHCGVTAMGVAGPNDTHPLHGELPNAPYQKAFLSLGEDDAGRFIALGGDYQHTVAFSHNYLAKPLTKVYENSNIFTTELIIDNLKKVEMELMYLAHINYRPLDNGRIVYSARQDAEHVRVRRSIPSHITPKAGYVEFIEELARHPEAHHVLKPGLNFDPEIVFFIDYLADDKGWAHSLMVHPDGQGSYMRHKPSQLDHGVRWISRSADQDALGIADPATAEPEGYSAEKAKGNLKIIPAGASWRMDVEMGLLDQEETRAMEKHIEAVIGK
ncbi:MAG: DUF4432 family protein [Trueperaceae bacterium]|nr:DUF4432 family protein [Trueperaceae bacterium]